MSLDMLERATITSKRMMYAHYAAGAFGNRMRLWESYDDYSRAGMPCPVGIRYMAPDGGGGPFVPDLAGKAVYDAILALEQQGWHRKHMLFQEATDNSQLVLQGEIVESAEYGYALFSSTARTHMRAALVESGVHTFGPGALLKLQAALCPSSYADMKLLLECYPGHAIEFSTYRGPVGMITGRNTVVWEVRAY